MHTKQALPAAWPERLAPAMLCAALAVLLIGGTLRGLLVAGVGGETAELLLFATGVLVLPVFAAAALAYFIRPRFNRPAGLAETAIMAAATALLAGLTLLVGLVGTGELEFRRLFPRAEILIDTCLAISLVALLCARFEFGRKELRGFLARRSVQSGGFILIALVSMAAFHGIDPTQSHFNFILRLVFAPPAPTHLGWGICFGLLFAAAVVLLVRAEAQLEGTRLLLPLRSAAIAAAVILPILYFDFSIPSEPFHYFVNVGPALAALDGRVLMVESFSQYGLGPVVATMLGFIVGPHTLGTAGVVVQTFNLAFFSVWLLCLYRMTPFKLAATALGFLGIGLFLAVWGYGGPNHNINVAPSMFGFRYLPILLTVLALSLLPQGRLFSAWTVLAIAFSTFWSMEATVASLGLHWAVIGFVGIRDRKPADIFWGVALSIIPAAIVLLIVVAATLFRAGVTPDYGTLLSFLAVYGGGSLSGWFKANDPDFFGWVAPLVAICIVMTTTWRCAIAGERSGYCDAAITKFMPMALLAAFMSAYFVGRSYSFMLATALLPIAALVIPGLLQMLRAWSAAPGMTRALSAIPFVVVTWCATATATFLIPTSSPYRLLIQECRDFGNCSLATLAEQIRFRLNQRPPLETTHQRLTDLHPDTDRVVQDTIAMIEKWGADQKRLTLLLGPMSERSRQRFFIPSEFALMYTGKWHTWPRLSTHMDSYNPLILDRIVKADVPLPTGALVVIRKDETLLPYSETTILKRIRDRWQLCPLPDIGKNVAAFRIADKDACSSLPPPGPLALRPLSPAPGGNRAAPGK